VKQYSFGIFGTGLIAGFHAKAINTLANACVRGFCSVSSNRADELAKEYDCKAYPDYQTMLDDPEIDIIAIATASGFHLEPCVAAAEAGKHVICEKPLEVSLERIDAMIAAHQKAGTLLGGIFQGRYTDAMAPLRKAIAEERFGRVSYAGAYVPWWRPDTYYDGSWHGTWKLDGGGALINQSIHAIDMLCDLMPPVKSVFAYSDAIAHPQIETEDTSVAVLRFGGGAMGVIYGTTASWPGQLKRFEITGDKGTAIYLEDSFSMWQFADERPEDEQIRKQFAHTDSAGGASDPGAINFTNHARNFAAFLDALESQQKFPLDGAEARKAVELVLALYQSSKENRPINLA
jgi:UDP-N-acetyl-2-amino-2-deoxyglucuronate dehydrogenase